MIIILEKKYKNVIILKKVAHQKDELPLNNVINYISSG